MVNSSADRPWFCRFDDDDDSEGGMHDHEDARLSKEIIQEVEYYQADPVTDSLSIFFCCALSPVDESHHPGEPACGAPLSDGAVRG